MQLLVRKKKSKVANKSSANVPGTRAQTHDISEANTIHIRRIPTTGRIQIAYERVLAGEERINAAQMEVNKNRNVLG